MESSHEQTSNLESARSFFVTCCTVCLSCTDKPDMNHQKPINKPRKKSTPATDMWMARLNCLPILDHTRLSMRVFGRWLPRKLMASSSDGPSHESLVGSSTQQEQRRRSTLARLGGLFIRDIPTVFLKTMQHFRVMLDTACNTLVHTGWRRALTIRKMCGVKPTQIQSRSGPYGGRCYSGTTRQSSLAHVDGDHRSQFPLTCWWRQLLSKITLSSVEAPNIERGCNNSLESHHSRTGNTS